MERAPRHYLARIIDEELDLLLGGLPAVAIEGAKAVGKTVTASRRADVVYQLDDPIQRGIAEADLDRMVSHDGLVLIDEWQLVPAVWDRVRRSIDSGAPPGSFLLTGSASPAGTGTHSGAGRIVSLRMRPLSLAERLEFSPTVSTSALLDGGRPKIEGATDIRLQDYVDEILRSGFPWIRDLSGKPRTAQLDGYLARVVDRDFRELGHSVRNPAALRRWMAAYAAATATTASFETIRDAATGGNDEKPAKTTVLPYRDVLERLFILDPVPAWRPSRSHIAELGSPPKHHLADPALSARLVGASKEALLAGEQPGPPIPRDGSYLGSLFDSLVTQSVRVYAQAAGARVGHMRTHGGSHEVDLIVERADGRVVAMEVKLASRPGEQAIRHLAWLGEQMGADLLDAVIVTTGSEAYRRRDGIAVVPAALLGP